MLSCLSCTLLWLYLGVGVDLPVPDATAPILWRFRCDYGPRHCVFVHVVLEGWRFFAEAKTLQHIAKPLRPMDRRSLGNDGKFLRVDPLGQFRQNRSHLIHSAHVIRVTDKVECR